jgi:hypothetical protein
MKPYTILLILTAFTANNLFSQTEYIVTVDPTNAHVFKIDSIPGVTWLEGYTVPTYCENNSQYTFIGFDAHPNSPSYLYTIDAITGDILSSPLLPDHNDYVCLRYSKTSNTLYGATWDHVAHLYSLITLDKVSGTRTKILDLPGFSAVVKLLVDDVHNWFYVLGADMSGDRILATIDITTGSTIALVNIPTILCLEYDRRTNKLYGLLYTYRVGFPPLPPITRTWTFCSVNPSSGVVDPLAEIPGMLEPVPASHETIDENDGRYFFLASMSQDTADYLFSISLSDGHVLNKVVVPAKNVLTKDNLIFYRYDNRSNKLYAMFWEAHTIHPLIDSTCNLPQLTRVYMNSSGHTLVVDKSPTLCKVTMNVYNAAGQLILTGKSINDGHNEFQLLNVSQGIYFYTLISNGKPQHSGKVLKR